VLAKSGANHGFVMAKHAGPETRSVSKAHARREVVVIARLLMRRREEVRIKRSYVSVDCRERHGIFRRSRILVTKADGGGEVRRELPGILGKVILKEIRWPENRAAKRKIGGTAVAAKIVNEVGESSTVAGGIPERTARVERNGVTHQDA